MTDRGNDAMLIAAGRHYDSLFDTQCCNCEEVCDEDYLEYEDEPWCGWCWESLQRTKMDELAEGLMIALGGEE